jgi:hypothetical protein
MCCRDPLSSPPFLGKLSSDASATRPSSSHAQRCADARKRESRPNQPLLASSRPRPIAALRASEPTLQVLNRELGTVDRDEARGAELRRSSAPIAHAHRRAGLPALRAHFPIYGFAPSRLMFVSKFVEPVASDRVPDCSSSCTSAASDIVPVPAPELST